MKTRFYFLSILSVLFLFSCSDDDGGSGTTMPAQPPVANFNIINDGCLAPCDISFESTSISSETPILAWDFGDGGSAGDVSSTSHTYQEGYYSVKLTVQNSGGTDEITKQVFVDNDPVNIYSNVRINQLTLTLLPSNMPIGNSFDITITDDLGQVVSSDISYVSTLPEQIYLQNSNASSRVNESFTFTITEISQGSGGDSASFTFTPSDYPPETNSNCNISNIVENGIGLDLNVCWEN